MKIVESAQQRNPEQITEQLNSLVDQLKSNVETAAQDGDSFDRMERTVLTSVLETGRSACVQSVPGFSYRPAAGRSCYGSFRRCSASIRPTIKRRAGRCFAPEATS